jgi:hypothetical protein
VPWIAFLLLVFWCFLEATIFTYTLYPTVSEVLADLVGMEAPRFTGPILFLFLLMLILGSFACLQAFLDTVKRREYKFLVQMLVVELFVMFFEVMFLYRELVDAITPWIAQQTSEQFRLGIGFTLSLAAFGWIGIRRCWRSSRAGRSPSPRNRCRDCPSRNRRAGGGVRSTTSRWRSSGCTPRARSSWSS